MRLLNAETFELRTFVNNPPPYAILSHVWGDEEVTYEALGNKAVRAKLKGWTKVLNCCHRALRDGWKYVWIDTCCIQKSDPTELSEAINSMFRWYQDAEICYAYLVDVPPKYVLRQADYPGHAKEEEEDDDDDDEHDSNRHNPIPWRWHFRSSRWHTRGWTLQELLAPRFLLFLDTVWGDIGSRETYESEIKEASGIESKHLRNFQSCSVATKLSWAANRQTRREEDRAYSLLGLLDINLPLIYGEGGKAFVRLQKELIQNHNDESVLAWNNSRRQGIFDNSCIDFSPYGSLARSPQEFQMCGGIIQWPFDHQRRAFSITNAGVNLNAEVFAWEPEGSQKPIYAVKLNCRREWPLLETKLAQIALQLETDDPNLVIFNRVEAKSWKDFNTSGRKSLGRKDIFISHRPSKQTGTAAVDSLVKFVCTPSIQLSAARWAKLDDHSGELTEQLWPDHYHLAKDMGIMYIELTFNYLRRVDKTYWIIMKPGPSLPLFGIWELAKDIDVRVVISRLEKTPEGTTTFPTCVGTSPGRSIELAMRPVPPLCFKAPKTYLIDVRFVDEELYNGEIGRFVPFVPFQPTT